MASQFRFSGQIEVWPEQFVAFVWSAPMRDLAAQVGMSDTGLRKFLSGIPLPPQGHWNRVLAGRPVPPPPKPAPRRPGQPQHYTLDERFASAIECQPLANPDGPFASALVPEDLDALRELTAKNIGKVGQARKLDPVHRAIAAILKREDQLRAKAAAADQTWLILKPLFDNPVDQRRLRILNTLFLALEKQHVGCDAHVRETEINAGARVGIARVSISLQPKRAGTHLMRYAYPGHAAALPLSTPLVLTINPMWGGSLARTWEDQSDRKLETRLAEIAVEVIVSGEAAYRRSCREQVERLEKAIRDEEEQRQQALAAANAVRFAALRRSGDLLREAENIRLLVCSVKDAVVGSDLGLTADELDAWQKWALGVADGIDPVRSGQINEHLRVSKVP